MAGVVRAGGAELGSAMRRGAAGWLSPGARAVNPPELCSTMRRGWDSDYGSDPEYGWDSDCGSDSDYGWDSDRTQITAVTHGWDCAM